ncbi:MAG: indole-3-glycerol phosphate synthase TrpC [Bacteroidetes bacterium]|nr:indole-3-glycerol phosphate synthase TrpC [Bacteroidota bacterium]
MATILDQIVEDTKGVVATRKLQTSIRHLEQFDHFGRKCLSLEDALRANAFSIIAEAKKASPSKGILRDPFDPVEIAQSYQKAGATAVSVLTEPIHFMGDIAYLASCRALVDIPLLRKDFIFDPYQIVEAKAFGADAILLIAAILSKNQLLELQAVARELGLSVLLEIYEEEELERIDLPNTPIIGANSRNLHTFEVDLHEAIRILSLVPVGCQRIAESGIRSKEDVLLLQDEGINGALIGESFMRHPNPGDALASFISAIS